MLAKTCKELEVLNKSTIMEALDSHAVQSTQDDPRPTTQITVQQAKEEDDPGPEKPWVANYNCSAL